MSLLADMLRRKADEQHNELARLKAQLEEERDTRRRWGVERQNALDKLRLAQVKIDVAIRGFQGLTQDDGKVWSREDLADFLRGA